MTAVEVANWIGRKLRLLQRVGDLVELVLDESPAADEGDGVEVCVPYEEGGFAVFVNGFEVLIDLEERQVRV